MTEPTNGNTEVEIVTEPEMLMALTKGEINQQIATAHRYPRSLKRFTDETEAMVLMSEDMAADCIYAIPRGKTMIEGPSIRFAEIANSNWGNSRSAVRLVDEKHDSITVQGAFLDLEKNVAVSYEVRRKILDKYGKRYSADMITMTMNAAMSIALRNAILKGIPKAFWVSIYEKARNKAMGDAVSIETSRAKAISVLGRFGATEEAILAVLGVKSVDQITREHIGKLRGIYTSIQNGELSPDEAFPKPDSETKNDGKTKAEKLAEEIGSQDTEPPSGPKQNNL